MVNEEDIELNDIYTCVTLKGSEPDQTAIVLTNWANNSGYCYKLSFPIYNEDFTKCKIPIICSKLSSDNSGAIRIRWSIYLFFSRE